MPEPKRAVAIVPVVILAASMLGRSAATSARNVGAPVTPSGAANTAFALCVARARVSVPVVVTGDPVTLKMDGAARATLVTVPEPTVIVCHDPSPRKNVVELATPLPKRAVAIVPVVILLASSDGISAATIERSVGAASAPVVGPARKAFAGTACIVAVIVPPAPDNGEPVTENRKAGKLRATADIVPVAAVFVARPMSPIV